MKKKISLPEIPIGHLNFTQLEELLVTIERITGHKIVLEIIDNKTKKCLTTIKYDCKTKTVRK